MKEDLQNFLLAKTPTNRSASSPPDLEEQQPTKRLKASGDFNLNIPSNTVKHTPARLEIEGLRNKTFLVETAATANADGSSSASLSFPVTLTSTPAQKGNDNQLNGVSDAIVLPILQQQESKYKIVSSSPTTMMPPPSRPPRTLNRSLLHQPEGGSTHAVRANASAGASNNATFAGPATDNVKSNHTNHNNHNSSSNNQPPSGSSLQTFGARAANIGNQNSQADNDTFPTDLSDPFIMLSTLLINLQEQVTTLEASVNFRATEFVKLATANVSTKHVLESMAQEWRHLVASMQAAVGQHAEILTNHSDVIKMLQEKLENAENQAKRDRAEVASLKSQVESMNTSMLHIVKNVEEQLESRRRFEETVLSSLRAVQHQGQQPRQEHRK